MQGYEEVHVPALKPKEFAAGEKLMPIAELPSWAQPAFKGMQTLNRVQSRVADMALFGADNMLLCAPTGAGKTNVAMLAILHELGQHMNEDGTIKLNDFKVVYVAPMKVSSSCQSTSCCKLNNDSTLCRKFTPCLYRASCSAGALSPAELHRLRVPSRSVLSACFSAVWGAHLHHLDVSTLSNMPKCLAWQACMA